MERHVTFVGALSIALSALGLFAAVVASIAIVGGGMASFDPTARSVTLIVGPLVGLFLLLVSLPGLIGGIGLLKRKSWARVLVMVYAILSLFSIPIGTAFGIYALWVLMKQETAKLFSSAPETSGEE